ncbi:hypothetical protein PAXRUDRAFT_35884 [Paxillus rubicundulus Ve08.2h10]|uniref:Uncharacterized protein n=1 Tax=Paxillus rubicundulus Ve08.2h10 TaxID=930991 RepID=A0A0D0D099_9AGAM|nr:hypothetical protein PAXRUDRAFT_35884 [Paxillus rubicundulus Ve08.2h10]
MSVNFYSKDMVLPLVLSTATALSDENITSQLNAQAAALEPIIHPLFCDLCGIDCATSKKTHIHLLALSVKKLEDCVLYEALKDGREVWHPDWLGKVDNDINTKFIAEVVKHVWNNKKAAKGRYLTVLNWLEEKAGGPGDGNELENNKDVIFAMIQTFLHFLSLHVMKIQVQANKQGPATKTTSASSDVIEPPKKCHKTQVKKLCKRVFNIAPRNMSEDLPSSRNGTPFSTMVSMKWKKEHPDMEICAKGREWLQEFFKRLEAGDIFSEDMVYLAELDVWHKPAHEVDSIDEEENHV